MIFGALLMCAVVSCGETTEEVTEEVVNTEAVMEMETATEDMVAGMEEMETEVEALGEDVDELLNEL